MSVMPRIQSEEVEWCENRVEPWTVNATAMGSSAPAIAAWEAKVMAARAALMAAEVARATAKNATQTLQAALQEMRVASSEIIKQVRVKAGPTNDPSIYALALIPPPALPGPVGEPGTPYDFIAELMQDGSLDVGWKCKNPKGCTGVLYQVWRRVGGVGAFTYVGGTGSKKFLDSTIPAGTSLVTYQIQAVRSTGIGNWAQYNVTFGNPAAPGSVTVTQAEALPRMAA